jgi:hypothetical protein
MKLRSNIRSLNNKEINNRLTNIIFPTYVTQIVHFTNDLRLIEDYIFPYLYKNKLMKDVLQCMSKESLSEENFNILFCKYTLNIIIGDK